MFKFINWFPVKKPLHPPWPCVVKQSYSPFIEYSQYALINRINMSPCGWEKYGTGSHYVTWLQKKGFIRLGSGAFSTVLGHPKSDRVIKVCHNPDAWIDYVYWGAKQGYAGRFVPKVYSFKKHPTFYVAVMEKLEYTGHRADEKSEACVANSLLSLSLNNQNDTAKQLLDLIVPGMEAFSQALRERFKGDRLDIHGGNIMFRKDGGMVVVDPVCHEFSQHWVRLREKHFSPVFSLGHYEVSRT